MAVLRARLLIQLLESRERAALDRGDDIRVVLRRALLQRVTGLARDHSAGARREVAELLTVLEGLGQSVPFEVQTRFYQIWQGGNPREPGMLELAYRLGFDARTV
jgi:hypothetical protein